MTFIAIVETINFFPPTVLKIYYQTLSAFSVRQSFIPWVFLHFHLLQDKFLLKKKKHTNIYLISHASQYLSFPFPLRGCYLQHNAYVALFSLSRTQNKLRNVNKKCPSHLRERKHQLWPLYVVFSTYFCIPTHNGIAKFKVVHKIYINVSYIIEIRIVLSR